MIARALALLLAAIALSAPPQAIAAPSPFGPARSVVRPGPPGLPVDPGRWLPWRVFTWRDGVKPGNPALTQDAEGYIWSDGPIRYNGRTWQTIEVPGEAGLVTSWSLLSASDGSLWFGRVDGGLLRRLRDGTWRRHPVGDGLPGGLIGALLEDGRGTVWAGTVKGLARCRGDRCVEEMALRGVNVRALALTRTAAGRPALWIGTAKGLFRLDGIDGASPVLSPPFADLEALPELSIRSIVETASPGAGRSLWIATDNGVARYSETTKQGGVWTRYDSRSGFPAGPVVTLKASRSPDGRTVVWAGSFRSGIFRFDEDGRWAQFDTRSGLPTNVVYNLLVTPGDPGGEPTLWAATPTGLIRLEREHWKAIDTRFGLPNEVVISAGEATFPDGLRTYWIGTAGGMVRLTSRGWEPFAPPPSGQPIVALEALNSREEDGSESFWIGSVDGLHGYAHGRWTTLTSKNSPLPYLWVQRLLAVPAGKGAVLWIGTPRGLARYDRGRWTVFGGDFPGNTVVHSLARTPSAGGGSAVWAGTDQGLGRFQDAVWEKVTAPCLPDPKVLSLLPETGPDGSGWLWIGTRMGLVRLRLDSAGRFGDKPGDCQALTGKTDPALPQAGVNQIQIDGWGRPYLFTDWGVTRLTLAPGHGLEAARIESFEARDGLPGMNFSGSFVDHLGRIWGGATGGAAVLDPAPPEPAARPLRPAPLRLEQVLVGGRERPLADGTALRHDENSIELQYALLSYRREHATRYRTQLVGLEKRPSPWTSEASVVYSRLPAGSYTFRLWGRDVQGTVAGPLEVRFRVRSAPWLSAWALALYALALIGLGYGASHVNTLSRRAATLETQVADRTRELAEANRQLELASLTDPLTGLSNRRVLALNIEPDVHQAVRTALGTAAPRERNSDLIFYFLDIDHFKQLNDRAGHAAGDRVLVELAGRLREAARNTDAVIRWGGEEFLVVSRWADRRSGQVLAERLLEAVAGKPFAAERDTGIAVTCSIGWAPYPWRPEAPEAVHYEAVMSLADRALYLAKKEGRNRAVGVLPGPHGALVPEGPLEEQAGGAVELARAVGPVRAEPARRDERQPA
jgi:diguanylate cyclase (GGDEF)-like protein